MFKNILRLEIILIILLILDYKYLFLGDKFISVFIVVLTLYLILAWIGLGIVLKIESYHKHSPTIKSMEFLSLHNIEDFIPKEAEEVLDFFELKI